MQIFYHWKDIQNYLDFQMIYCRILRHVLRIELTNTKSKQGTIRQQETNRVPTRAQSRGQSSNYERHIVDGQSIQRRPVRYPPTKHSTHRVGQSYDRQYVGSLLQRDTLVDSPIHYEHERHEETRQSQEPTCTKKQESRTPQQGHVQHLSEGVPHGWRQASSLPRKGFWRDHGHAGSVQAEIVVGLLELG